MKKFLSLVLALIMTMSLVTISAGATEYRDLTDKDEIQYEEAVAVLNRIGVITGYEDGSFRPETELTRGAAAKIIVSLLIGPEAASNLPNATAPYPDVPASHTFAGVISYCKTAGIISGYGDGTFKPGNSLTGFAFAKMLLGALGYKSEIEGFVDTGWTMNVARVGNVTGLFDRLDFDGSAAVNREEACQLALNTLKATMVTYGGTTLVTGAQALAVQGTQAMYVTSNNREINANINRRVISAANNEMTLEFGEEHFKDLRLEHDKYDPAYDEYGHPSDEWSWKKVTIGTFPLPADFTFTKLMSHLEDTDATKEKALGLRNYDTWSVDHRSTYSNWSSAASSNNFGYFQTNSPFADVTQIHINGWKARVNENNGKIYDYVAPKNTSARPANAPDIAEIADLTDNGVTVEVYVCPVDADFITDVVVTRTQLMKVKRVGADTITLEDVEPDSRDPRTASTPSRAPITGFNNYAIDVTEEYDNDGKKSFLADVKDDNYDAFNALKDMKAGDYVAVIPYTTDKGLTWEVGEAYAPETVSGAFTKVDTYANVNKRDGSAVAITVGGTSYPINEWNKDMLDVTGNKIKATKKDVTLYLAKDGTALLADEIGISDAWMVVGDYYQATGSNSKVAWFVHGWTIGGEEVDLDLGTIRGAAEKYAPGELVYYSIADGGDGEYQLSKPNNNAKSWPKNSDEDGDTGYFGEPRRSTTKDNKIVYTGEGIYDVSQYTIERAASKNNVKTTLVSRDGAIALEKYSIGAGLTDTANGLTLYKTADGNVGPDGNPVKVTPHKTANPHNFQYRNVPYNGVKFIFVNFDATNGNVETIEFKKGAQNVEYQDLITFNQYWANIGTNDGKNYVVSPAEAYVNDKGEVKAVVVKTDSSEADLSRVAVITDTPGDKDKDRKDSDEGAGATVTYAKRYVTGPSFSMADEKTGVFDKDYAIGDILIISEKDGVIVGKKFHSNYYNNSNPDAVFVEGIGTVKRGDGKVSKIGFTIGGKDSAVYTLNKQYPLYAEGTNTDAIPGSDKVVELLTNKNTVALDTNDDNTKGLVVVTGDTTFVDLRAINQDTIESLDDLFEYDLSSLRLRLLVNGALNSDTFRRAYAVIVEQAKDKKDDVKTPDVEIKAAGTTYNETTKKNEANIGSQVVLTAVADPVLSGTDKSTTYQWYTVLKSADGKTETELPIAGATGAVLVVDKVIRDDTIYRVRVTNTDTTKKDKKTASNTFDYVVTGVDGQTGGATKTVKFENDVPKLNGTGIGASGALVGTDGKVQINLNLTAPDFVKQDDATKTANAGVKVEATVSVGGVPVKTFKGASALGGNVDNTGIVAIPDNSITNMTPGSAVEVVITKVTYDTVVIEYQDAEGKDITDKITALANVTKYVGPTATDIVVKYPSTDDTAAHAPVVSVVSGLTTTPAAATLSGHGGVGVWNNGGSNTFTGAIATGTEKVVIKIDDSKLTRTYGITINGKASFVGNLDEITDGMPKEETPAAGKTTLTVTPVKTPVTGDEFGSVKFRVSQVHGGPAYKWTVYYKVGTNGTETSVELDPHGNGSVEETKSIGQLTADTNVIITKVETASVQAYAETGTYDSTTKTATITFNKDITDVNTGNILFKAAGGSWAALTPTAEVKRDPTDTKTLIVKLGTESPNTGDKLTVDNAVDCGTAGVALQATLTWTSATAVDLSLG